MSKGIYNVLFGIALSLGLIGIVLFFSAVFFAGAILFILSGCAMLIIGFLYVLNFETHKIVYIQVSLYTFFMIFFGSTIIAILG